MNSTLELAGHSIEYTLKVSKRSRRVSLIIYPGGKLVVSVPRGVSSRLLEQFVAKKSHWIIDKLNYFANLPSPVDKKTSKKQFLENKKKALQLARERLQFFNQVYNFKYHKISIKNQRSRWGSCSRQGNINFNYKIALLPPKLADYIIVHELCHLGAFNHSRKFWDLVAQTVPDYAQIRREIKMRGLRFG